MFEVSDTMGAVLQVATGVISTLQVRHASSLLVPELWDGQRVIMRGGYGGWSRSPGAGGGGMCLVLPLRGKTMEVVRLKGSHHLA